MTVKFIVNELGDLAFDATELSSLGYASTESGYSVLDVISGPRSTFWRSVLTGNDKALIYKPPINYLPDHVVIARADKLLTVGTYRVQGIKDSPSFGSTISGFDKNPLAFADLIGLNGQDYCQSFSESANDGWGVKFTQIGSTPEAAMVSKVYFGVGFDFGKQITPKVTQIAELPRTERTFSFPVQGDLPFEIEARLALAFTSVSGAKIDQFLALPHILDWPFFIYDPNTYVFPWKLEHVFLERYTLTHKNYDIWDVQLILARLKQYE